MLPLLSCCGILLLVLPATAAQPSVEGEVLSFRLVDLEGNRVESTDEGFRDKVMLVDLWGTWCAPCLSVIPTFVELQERYRDEGLVVLGIAFERENDVEKRRSHLRDFAEEHGINYVVLDGGSLRDFKDSLPAMRNVRGFPVEVLIDREGKVAAARNGYGYKKRWAKKLERELTELLGIASE